MSERTQTGERAACTRHVLDNFEADRDLHVNGFERDRGFADSPLEGERFEPSVPRQRRIWAGGQYDRRLRPR